MSKPPTTPPQTSTSIPKLPHSESPEQATEKALTCSAPTRSEVSTVRSRSSERLQKLRVKNRRKLYLDRHPSYFTSPDLELADPLLYDRCIRRFQTAAEREADGRAKGYSGVLEADLYRTEAKILALQPSFSSPSQPKAQSVLPKPASDFNRIPFVSYQRGRDGEVLPEEDDEVPQTREEGWGRWVFGMTVRFLRGDDEDFEYEMVDASEEDEVERREREEEWFEAESPGWANDEVAKEGETGVQDF
ncbi:hypothetical protein BUE80_DR005620 [Diplocarpon rosae]|nr:hypothetical protein BUE80_DR005620 [Diplocarpon rosae]